MWANNYFRAGAAPTNSSDNPYIDYSNFYNQTENYTSQNAANSGLNITNLQFPVQIDSNGNQAIYWDGESQPDLNGTYKFIVIESDSTNVSGTKYVNFKVMEDTTELTLDDYILYIREKNAVGTNTGWRLGNGQYDQGLDTTINNSNNAGTYDPNFDAHNLRVATATTIFYRIGLKNGSGKKFNKIQIQYKNVVSSTASNAGQPQTFDFAN